MNRGSKNMSVNTSSHGANRNSEPMYTEIHDSPDGSPSLQKNSGHDVPMRVILPSKDADPTYDVAIRPGKAVISQTEDSKSAISIEQGVQTIPSLSRSTGHEDRYTSVIHGDIRRSKANSLNLKSR